MDLLSHTSLDSCNLYLADISEQNEDVKECYPSPNHSNSTRRAKLSHQQRAFLRCSASLPCGLRTRQLKMRPTRIPPQKILKKKSTSMMSPALSSFTFRPAMISSNTTQWSFSCTDEIRMPTRWRGSPTSTNLRTKIASSRSIPTPFTENGISASVPRQCPKVCPNAAEAMAVEGGQGAVVVIPVVAVAEDIPEAVKAAATILTRTENAPSPPMTLPSSTKCSTRSHSNIRSTRAAFMPLD